MAEKPNPFAHGPRPTARIKASSFAPDMLAEMLEQGRIMSVPSDWVPEGASMPAQTNYVMYPNGDLQRVAFTENQDAPTAVSPLPTGADVHSGDRRS